MHQATISGLENGKNLLRIRLADGSVHAKTCHDRAECLATIRRASEAVGAIELLSELVNHKARRAVEDLLEARRLGAI